MKKRISILINSIEGGGAERTAAQLLNELKDDFDIHLVLLYNIVEYSIPQDQKIFCYDLSPSENIIIKYLRLPWLAFRYKKYCKDNNIEKSLSFLTRSHYINAMSKMLGSGCRIMLSEQAHVSTYLTSLGRFNKAISKLLTKTFYSKADLIITNAELIKRDLQTEFKINTAFSIIHNPVDLNKINQLKAEATDPSLFNTFTFINVGSFRPQKNHTLLIDAFYKIKHLDCRLLLMGKGGKNEYSVREQVKRLNMESRIIFAGFDVNPFKFLAQANCFVLSSDFEGFPNVMQEALACSLPVISTDCKSGPREILAPGTDINLVTRKIELAEYGILIPPNDVQLLADAMELIYTDNTLLKHYKEKSFKRALHFDAPEIISRFSKVLLYN